MLCHMQEQRGIRNRLRSLCIRLKILNNHIQLEKIQLKKLISIHLQVEELISHYQNNKKQVVEKMKDKKLLKGFKKVKIKNRLKRNLNNILKMYKILQNNLHHSQHQNPSI